jgi:exonuclease SbcC
MIKSISIENFQSHKSTSIDFCTGLNVIAGASDSGKSSVLRAMAWIIKNRPSGDAIRNWNCKKTDTVAVEMVLDDNGKEETLSKERTGSNTRYLSSKFGTLSVIGRDVPEEVSRLLNLSDSNFQTQHDAYFLLNDSPGSVAKTLNDLVGLSIIDTIFKNINSKSLYLKRQSEENQVTIDKLVSEIERYQDLDKFEKELLEAESLSGLLEQKQDQLSRIAILVNSINDTQNDLEKAKKILPAEKDLAILKKKNENLNQITGYHYRLSNIIASINESQSRLNEKSEWLTIEEPYLGLRSRFDNLKNLQAKQSLLSNLIIFINQFQLKLKEESEWLAVEEPYLELKFQFDKQKNLQDKQSLLSKIIESYSSNKCLEQNAIKKIDALKLELKHKIESNGICPTCFRPLDKKTIEGMIQ